MANRPDQFPLDLTGKSPRNLVQNEERTFTTYNDRIFVPSAGVYYTESMIIHDKATGRRLRPITDYKCLHLHEEASLESGLQACCVVIVHNEEIRNIKFNYQVPGGHYSETLPALRKLLEGVDFQSLTRISWGTQVYGKPETFPAAAHKHPGSEFGDWKRFHVALNNIYHALLHKDHAAWQAVYDYIDASVRSNTQNTLGDNYFTKVELENKLAGITAPFVSKVYADAIETRANTKIKELTDRLTAEGVKITDLQRLVTELQARDQVKISPDAGNLLEKRENGLYYGIQAPADLSGLFVDAVNGDDNNPGTKAQPFKTLDKALTISPEQLTNTIYLKSLTPEQKKTHCYYVSKRYNIRGGASRSIRAWGDPWVDGDQRPRLRAIATGGRSEPSHHTGMVRPPIRFKWFNVKFGQLDKMVMGGFALHDNSRIVFDGMEIHMDQVPDVNLIHPYTEYHSIVLLNGQVSYVGCKVFKVLSQNGAYNFTLADKDVNSANSVYQSKFQGRYMAWSNRNCNLTMETLNTLIGYSTDYAPTGRQETPVPIRMFETEDERANIGADFAAPSEYHSFMPLRDTTLCKLILLAQYNHFGREALNALNLKLHPDNANMMLTTTNALWGVKFNGDVMTNVSSTRIFKNFSAGTTPKAYTETRESIYRQHFKPNDLYESINTYRSSAEVANVVGYGHWARWGQGLTTVGKGGQASGDQAGMPDFMFLHGIVGGEYAHRLTIAEMPNHKHRFVADDSSLGFPGSERTGRRGGNDFSQKNSSGPAFEYFTPRAFPDESGGDQPHNNIQPSVAVDRWVRLVSNDGQHYTGLNIVNGQFQLTTTGDYSTDTWMVASQMNLAGITITNTGSWEIHSIKLVQPSGDNPNTRIHVRLKCKIPEVLSTHMLFGHTEDGFVWKVPNSHPRWGWQRSIDAEGLTEFVFAVREVVPTQPSGGETQTLPDGSTITLPATGGRLLKPNTRYKVVSQNQSRLAFYAK